MLLPCSDCQRETERERERERDERERRERERRDEREMREEREKRERERERRKSFRNGRLPQILLSLFCGGITESTTTRDYSKERRKTLTHYTTRGDGGQRSRHSTSREKRRENNWSILECDWSCPNSTPANDSTCNSGEQAGVEKNAVVVAWGGDHGSGGGDDGGCGSNDSLGQFEAGWPWRRRLVRWGCLAFCWTVVSLVAQVGWFKKNVFYLSFIVSHLCKNRTTPFFFFFFYPFGHHGFDYTPRVNIARRHKSVANFSVTDERIMFQIDCVCCVCVLCVCVCRCLCVCVYSFYVCSFLSVSL